MTENPQPDNTLEEIEMIQEAQGWSRNTMLDLYKDFVNEKNLTADFLAYIKEVQREEHGETAYSNLTDVQVEQLRQILIDISAAGNEGPTDSSVQQAWSIYSDYNTEEIIDELNANNVDLRGRVDFDPETGEAWETKDDEAGN